MTQQQFKSVIPEHIFSTYCYGEKKDEIRECDYYITYDCPATCLYARRLKQGITHSVKTGLERFISRYGENYKK